MFESFSKKDPNPNETYDMQMDNHLIRVEGSDKRQKFIKNLSDERLIKLYRESQREADRHIGDRNYREKVFSDSEVGKSLQEESQMGTVAAFQDLNKLRAEIDRRELKVPTMEELEKNESKEKVA